MERKELVGKLADKTQGELRVYTNYDTGYIEMFSVPLDRKHLPDSVFDLTIDEADDLKRAIKESIKVLNKNIREERILIEKIYRDDVTHFEVSILNTNYKKLVEVSMVLGVAYYKTKKLTISPAQANFLADTFQKSIDNLKAIFE